MKKIYGIVTISILFFLPLVVSADHFHSDQGSLDVVIQSTTGATTNGAGTSLKAPNGAFHNYTMIIDRTAGATDVVEINLECSIDNVIWPVNGYEIFEITNLVSEPLRASSNANQQYPCNYIRYNIITIGAGNTLTLQISTTTSK